MRQLFNPFGKKFSEVKKEDLEILKSVAEGWNIEYKSQKPNARDISKSISSFANSHGGIYFVGIEEDGKTNCAKNILGVSDSPDDIRDAVQGNLQPFPFFETFSINLENDKKVLMAVVPSGENTPYINSNGKIYRRQASASDPITSESNRFAIDELYRRAKNYEKGIEKFRNSEFTFCNLENDTPYLEIYANTIPFNHFVIKDFFKEEVMGALLNQFNGEVKIEEKKEDGSILISFTSNIKFDSIQTYSESISIRNLENQDLAYNGLTIEIDISGNLKLLIPLNKQIGFSGAFGERFSKVLKKSNEDSISSINFLDTRHIFGSILALVNRYVDYLEQSGYTDKLEFKMRLRNCWRTSLYIDSEKFIEYVEKFGVPICMKSEQDFPKFPSLIDIQDIKNSPIIQTASLFSHVANSLGVCSNTAFLSVIEEIQTNPQSNS